MTITCIPSGLFRSWRNLIIAAIVRALRIVWPALDALMYRIDHSPGIPVPNPSNPYWLLPPSPIATHGSSPDAKLPAYADVVIIGSGITGTSVARELLDWERDHKEGGEPLQVVMLEARDTCSGATGRNGGHINPLLYADYTELKDKHGLEIAKQIIRFRLEHKAQLLAVAAEEGLLEESQCREVQAFDVYHDSGLYQAAKKKLATYRADLPEEGANFQVHEGEGVIKDLQLSDRTAGCFSTRAGAVHPYRLVTGILSRLLQEYSNFQLFTQTPCTAISSPDSNSSPELYNVITPRGTIQTPHVIHATNGWISHLLPALRGKIIPARAVMTAQRPPSGLGEAPAASTPSNSVAPQQATASTESWAGMRSFVFYPEKDADSYDYLTQQRTAHEGANGTRTEYPPPAGEMMLGSVMGQGDTLFTEFGNTDDRQWNVATQDHLQHALDSYFDVGNAKGEEKKGDSQDDVNSVWGGILAVSVDLQPWVGRVSSEISGRHAPVDEGSKSRMSGSSTQLAASGEWMAAGYSGEGMCHAWMSGKALAHMVLGLDEATVGRKEKERSGGNAVEGWLPPVFRVSEERWKRAVIEDLIADFLPG